MEWSSHDKGFFAKCNALTVRKNVGRQPKAYFSLAVQRFVSKKKRQGGWLINHPPCLFSKQNESILIAAVHIFDSLPACVFCVSLLELSKACPRDNEEERPDEEIVIEKILASGLLNKKKVVSY